MCITFNEIVLYVYYFQKLYNYRNVKVIIEIIPKKKIRKKKPLCSAKKYY